MVTLPDYIMYNLLLALITLIIGLYLFFTSTFNYWKDRGVPYVKPVPFFGNLKDMFLSAKHLMDVHQDIYDQLKGSRYGGFFEMRKPALIIRDPELVQQVLIKDFTHFYDRGFSIDAENDPLSANLFNLEGDDWRHLRYKLTPTFTTGKLKGMFEQICKCGEEVNAFIEKQSKTDKSIEAKSLMSSFALDVIASCAFGLQLDKNTDLMKSYIEVVNSLFKPSKIQAFRQALLMFLPKVARKIGIKQFPERTEKVLLTIIKETLKYRRESKINRNDFLQLILNLQKQEQSGIDHVSSEADYDADDEVIDQMKHAVKDQDEKPTGENKKVIFTEMCIATQSFVFLVGGSESVSSPLGFTLYALTKHPQIQEKVHDEVDSVLANHKNQWSYQAVKEMTYLDQVIQETLRKYPTAVSLFRICTQNYKIPGSNDVIEKGTRILIPVHAIHNDPDNHESPEIFDPERFVNNNFKPNGTFLPFGDGPRVCIAMRFAVLEMKVVLSRILSEYTVRLSDKTKLPIKIQINAMLPIPEGGFWFEFDKRQKFFKLS